MQTETIIRHHYCLLEWLELKRHGKVAKDVGQLVTSYFAAGNTEWYRHFGKELDSFLRR